MATISIIIPVYKTEIYLKKCVDSILKQTFADFELILIDDGSTDKCPFICNQYARRDKRVIVIHQDNKGQAIARNTGLEYVFSSSKSKYISFVDSDDYVDRFFLEKMYNGIKGCDISICLYNFDDEGKITTQGKVKNKTIKSDKYWKLNLGPAGSASIWNKLYNKSLFSDIRIPNKKIIEDEYIIYKLISKSAMIRTINEYLYFYTYHKDSLCRSTNHHIFSKCRMDLFKEKMSFIQTNKTSKHFVSNTLNSYFYTESWYLSKGYDKLINDYQENIVSHIDSIPFFKISLITHIKKFIWKLFRKKYYKIIDFLTNR